MERSCYSPSQLREIGSQNANRLPPASAVYNMAMYELQRDAETERLFHDNMIAFSKIREGDADTQARLDSLARAVKRCESHHMHNMSLTGVRIINEALHHLASEPNVCDEATLFKLSTQIADELEEADFSSEDQIAVVATLMASQLNEVKMALENTIKDYNQATGKTLLEMKQELLKTKQDLLEAKNRISKLEDLVRVLTLQKSTSSDSPKKTHFIPVSASDGQTIELSVPRGSSLVPLKDSRASSRSATPINFQTDQSTDSEKNDSSKKREVPVSQENSHHSAARMTWTATPDDEKPLPPVPAAQASSNPHTSKGHVSLSKEKATIVSSGPSDAKVQTSPVKAATKPSVPIFSASKPEARFDNNLTPQAKASPDSKPFSGSKRVVWKDSPLFQGPSAVAPTVKPQTSSPVKDNSQSRPAQLASEGGNKSASGPLNAPASVKQEIQPTSGGKLNFFWDDKTRKLFPGDKTKTPDDDEEEDDKLVFRAGKSPSSDSSKDVLNKETNYVTKTTDKAGAAKGQAATPRASTMSATQSATAPSLGTSPAWVVDDNASRGSAFDFATFKMTTIIPGAENKVPHSSAPVLKASTAEDEGTSASSGPDKNSPATSARSFIKRSAVKLKTPQTNAVQPPTATQQSLKGTRSPWPSPQSSPSLTPVHPASLVKDEKVASGFASALPSPAQMPAATPTPTPTPAATIPKSPMSAMAPSFQPSPAVVEPLASKDLPPSLKAMLTPDKLRLFQAKAYGT